MSITALQEHIRKKKTPLALGLGPEANRLPAPVVKRFTDLYGESVMARSEALRYHGTQLMAQAAQRLPAVVLRADRYLLCGAMGLDVLSNLVHMARSQGLYAIVDARCADPAVWLGGEVNADAVTVSPYYGAAAAGEDKALLRWSARRSRVRRRCRTSWLGIAACFWRRESRWPAGGPGSWPRRITVWMCGSCGGG